MRFKLDLFCILLSIVALAPLTPSSSAFSSYFNCRVNQFLSYQPIHGCPNIFASGSLNLKIIISVICQLLNIWLNMFNSIHLGMGISAISLLQNIKNQYSLCYTRLNFTHTHYPYVWVVVTFQVVLLDHRTITKLIRPPVNCLNEARSCLHRSQKNWKWKVFLDKQCHDQKLRRTKSLY